MAITPPDITPPLANPSKPRHRLPPASCDSHAHIFGPQASYPYATKRSYTPHDASLEDYTRLLHYLGFERAVLVQPSVYGTDNRLMMNALQSVQGDDADLGIGWRGVVVLDDSVTDAELEHMHSLGVRGIRLNLLYQGADVGYAQAARLAQRIAPLGWHVQFLVNITTFEDFAGRLARLPVDSVIDHFGHFLAGKGVDVPEFIELKTLMRDGRSWVKLSGPNRITSHDAAPFSDVQLLAEDLLEHAPNRLVFGTDWPHVQMRTSMPDDGVLVDELYRWTGNDAALIQQVLVDNPAQLYGF